jgi:tetratricopeptide (TPR) repeat protein
MGVMVSGRHRLILALAPILLSAGSAAAATPTAPPAPVAPRYASAVQPELIGPDALDPVPPDLELRAEGVSKAEALARYAEGILYEEAADPERALQAYIAALDRDPGNTELAVRVAYELGQANDTARAIRILKDAVAASPREALPHLQLAWLYARQGGRSELALRHANAAAEIDPLDPDVLETQAQILLESGQTTKALTLLDRAGRAKTEDPEYWVRLAEIRAKLARPDASKPASVEGLKRAAAAIRKAAERAAADPDLLQRLGDLRVGLDQAAEAVPLYRSALVKAEAGNAESAGILREKLVRTLVACEQNVEAAELLQRMIRDDPTRAELHEMLGQIREAQSDLPSAIAQYEQVVLLNPGLPAAHLRLADLLLQTRQPEKAVAALTEARARFPGVAQLTSALGIAYSQSKRHSEAIAAFEQSAHEAHVAGRTDLLDAAFYFQYGAACEQAGQFERAAELLQKSIELDPKNAATAQNYLGYMWADRGVRLDEAETLIRKALLADPDNGPYRDSLGWVLFRKGRFDQALRELLRASELVTPPDAVVLEHVGDAYEKLGDTGQALSWWTKAAALDPDNARVAGKVDRLRGVHTDAKPSP